MSEKDLEILIEQTNISRDIAKKLLLFKNGDVVESILEAEKYEDTDSLLSFIEKENNIQKNIKNDEVEKDVDLSLKSNIEEYRNIVDCKDTMYNYKAQLKEKQKKKNKLIQERLDKGESIEDLEEKKLCNESIYYSFRNGNVNNIKVL